MNIKTVKVNGIVTGTDINGKTAERAVLDAASANQIHNFDVFVDGDEMDQDDIKEIGADWESIEIRTVEKPAR